MLNRGLVRFNNKADIYSELYLTNDMGQKVAYWNLAHQGIKCYYSPGRSSTNIRISPAQTEANFIQLYFNYDAPIDYGLRIKNITTIFGDEVIESDWFQVIQIDKEMSYTGKVQYLGVRAKSVIE
jgi:hypothetical protein